MELRRYLKMVVLDDDAAGQDDEAGRKDARAATA